MTLIFQSKAASQENQKLNRLVNKSQHILYHISAVFPFDFYPDELIIDENQVSTINRRFFYSEYIETILIRDIQNVNIETAPLFAKLTIVNIKPLSKPIEVSYLKLNEATKAQRVIQGLRAAKEEKIDISKIPQDEVLEKLEAIGKPT